MADKPDQYDFFMKTNTAPAPKKSLLPGAGSSMKSKLFMVLGILILIIVGTMLARTFLNRADSDTRTRLTALAQQQNELIRISDIGTKKARGLEAKNLAQTTQVSMSSEQKALQTAIRSQKVKVSNSTLNAAKKKETDNKLTIAEQNNSFDQVFLEILKADLMEYQESLKEAHDKATTKTFKDTLATQYQKAATLAGVNPER